MNITFNPFTNNLDFVGSGSGGGLTGAGIYFNAGSVSTTDPAVDGAWFITTSGNNLSFQRRESGVYVEKSSITP